MRPSPEVYLQWRKVHLQQEKMGRPFPAYKIKNNTMKDTKICTLSHSIWFKNKAYLIVTRKMQASMMELGARTQLTMLSMSHNLANFEKNI